MDQPNSYDDESNKSELTEGVPHSDQSPAVSIPITTDTTEVSDDTDQSESEPIVVSSDSAPFSDASDNATNDSQPESEQSTELSEPSEPTNESTESAQSDSIAAAEHNVEEANPEPIRQELAEVTTEIESFVAEPAQETPSEPVGVTEEPMVSNDPMQQIMANEAAEQVSADPVQNFTDVSTETTGSESSQAAPEQPVSNEALIEEANAEMASSNSVASGQMINDVIAPSAVAAATVAGTAGLNAITGTPEAGAPNSAEPRPPQPKKQKSKKNVLLVVMVVLIALLFGGAAVAAYMLQPDDTAEDTSQTEQETTGESENEQEQAPEEKTTAEPGQQVEALSLDDFKAACGAGGKVINSASYEGNGPHPMAVFEKGVDDKYALSVLDFTDKSWTTEPEAYTVNQLVVCIERDDKTAKMLKTCPITDPTTKVTSNVDLYSTGYTVNVVEAATGTVVDTFTNNSSSTVCPTTASYNKADPKIYAELNLQALQTSLATYANAKL